ncbi:hypothetical protein [Lactobacillus xylocopicola]|uniref:Uncharacterized protein n=1 Tax=Lactobacillus xylocopicola TaxID=2976676 RepID=A0ABN6SMN2_9LACO|nr:hypothetical protein [Lactobacillus xylocopicola]BDR60973.1 hypothetical protein KIM322_12340 [Lactobacillus xylocopicola]
MNSKEANAIIDDLNEQNHNDYYIDFVPITFPNEDFAELADYLEKHYKPDFANKIVFIAFTIMHYYESYVSLVIDGDEDEYENDEDYEATETDIYFSKLRYKDLRHLGLEELAKLISKMVIDNYRGINILFKNDDKFSLMAIEDEYDTYFRNLSGNALKLVDQLVNHQGIYLKKAPNN